MGINGIEQREVALPPEFAHYYERSFRLGQLAVFGAERLAADEDNVPTAEAVDELIWQIEELCTGPGAQRFHGIGSRSLKLAAGQENGLPLQLAWNPAGTVGGFAPNLEWDGALASVATIRQDQYWAISPGALLPRPHIAREGLFIDRSGVPKIRRTVRTGGLFKDDMRSSSKLANAEEVRGVADLLRPVLEEDRVASVKPAAKLPVHVEVGYGLDPMALRGGRDFTTKICVEVDKAVGSYENPVGAYPAAVQAESRRYAAHVREAMADQHISFAIGDGGRLPLRTASVSEVFMSNVLNAPLDEETRLDILKEARRVLGASGNLVTRVNWHRDEWPHDRMVRLLRRTGFRVVRSVDQTDPEYRSLELQYGTPAEVVAPAGYFLIALATG